MNCKYTCARTYTHNYIRKIAQAKLRNHINRCTSNISLLNPTLVPTAPLSLSASGSSASSIQLSWNQPTALNGILHDYRVRFRLSSDLSFSTPISAGTQLTYNVPSLKPFTDYELQVHQSSFASLAAVIAYFGLYFYILCSSLHLRINFV